MATILLAGIAATSGQAQSTSADVDEEIARLLERYEAPSRKVWQRPVQVVEMLALRDGDVVADLGAGTGYFTLRLAASITPTGKVYAVETDPALVKFLGEREGYGKIGNIFPILADPDDPNLPDGEIDVVFTVNTWHHIRNRRAYLKRLERALSDRGRLVLIDYRAGELPVGPPSGHKLPRAKVVKEFEKAGWRLVAESVALKYQYHLTFLPPR